MNKKGQITVFIGIAIVMLIAIGAVIYFMQKEVAPEHIRRLLVDVPEMAKPIAGYIYSCIDAVAPAGIIAIGRGGGYIYAPEFLETAYGDIGYGYRKGRNTLATIEEMETQLSSYMGAAVFNCFDPSLFEKQGYTIEIEEIISQTQIFPKKVVFTINMPMKLTKGESTVELADFVFESNLPLGRLHSIAQKTVEELQKNPEGINLLFTQGINEEIELLPVDLENFIVAVRDPQVLVQDEPLTFMMATEHAINEPPEFTNLPNTLLFTDGQQASFTVQAEDPEDDPITFEADPVLFYIDEQTGNFTFTPEIAGTYPVEFRVKDNHGNVFKKMVDIIIEE